MTGLCSQCRRTTTVARFRLAYVGLRPLCADCSRWCVAAGMAIAPVPDEDPRTGDRRQRERRHLGIGQRAVVA